MVVRTLQQSYGSSVPATTVPDDYQFVCLGDVACIRKGMMKTEDNDLTPYISLEHINPNGTLKGYGSAGDSASPKTVFLKGDTLYGKLRPNLRKVIRVNVDGVCSTDILAIYGNELIDDAFLSHLLRSDKFYEHAIKDITGTRMPRTSWNHLQKFKLLLPTLLEQQNIAAVLDSIDKVILTTENVCSMIEKLHGALLHELLTYGIPGWHTEWKNVRGVGTVPVDWRVVSLGDICDPPEYGAGLRACPFDQNLPRYVRITDITENGRLHHEDARSVEYQFGSIYELQTGDLLFARSGSVGKTYLYKLTDGHCIFAGYLIRFRPNEEVALPEYVSIYTHSIPYQHWVASMSRVGAQPNINAMEYSSLPIPLPPVAEQQIICQSLNIVEQLLDNYRHEVYNLVLLRASMLDRLLC